MIVPTTPLYGPTGTIVLSRGDSPVVWSGSIGDCCRLLVVPIMAGAFSDAMWPRRRTVSSGSLTNISMRDVKNEDIEYAVGVSIGSMLSHVRRKSGKDVLTREGIVLWRMVIGRSCGGHENEGRARREGRRARGPEETDVRMSLSS